MLPSQTPSIFGMGTLCGSKPRAGEQSTSSDSMLHAKAGTRLAGGMSCRGQPIARPSGYCQHCRTLGNETLPGASAAEVVSATQQVGNPLGFQLIEPGAPPNRRRSVVKCEAAGPCSGRPRPRRRHDSKVAHPLQIEGAGRPHPSTSRASKCWEGARTMRSRPASCHATVSMAYTSPSRQPPSQNTRNSLTGPGTADSRRLKRAQRICGRHNRHPPLVPRSGLPPPRTRAGGRWRTAAGNCSMQAARRSAGKQSCRSWQRFKTSRGGPCRDRTCDPLIKSQLLYQLS